MSKIYFGFSVVFLVLIDLCLHQVQSADTEEPLRCVYFKNTSIINCNRGIIQCQNTSYKFTGFNVSELNELAVSYVTNQENLMLTELIKFYLYPKIAENTYHNFTKQVENTFYRYSVYYSPTHFDDGFRVTDLDCYGRLVRYFRSKDLDKLVKVTVKSATIEETISVFGFITIE